MFITETEAIFLTIDEYIKSKEKFNLMPFVTIYAAIMELINDGYIDETAFEKAGGSDVAIHKQKSTWPVSRGLHGSGYFYGNR